MATTQPEIWQVVIDFTAPGGPSIGLRGHMVITDEVDGTTRTTSFRAEWLEEADLQGRANGRGANATNKLSWHDVDLVEAVKEWLAKKRYEDPTNVEMIAPEPEPEPEPEP